MLSNWLEGESSWYYELSFNVIKIIMFTKFRELLNASLAVFKLSNIKILKAIYVRGVSHPLLEAPESKLCKYLL